MNFSFHPCPGGRLSGASLIVSTIFMVGGTGTLTGYHTGANGVGRGAAFIKKGALGWYGLALENLSA